MESNELDNLFKNALAEHEFPPQEKMWKKIEGRLPNKNKGIVLSWFNFGIAAAFMGAIVMATLIFLFQKNNSEQKFAQQKIENKSNEIAQNKAIINDSNKKQIATISSEKKVVKKRNSENFIAPKRIKNTNATIQLNLASNTNNSIPSTNENLKSKNLIPVAIAANNSLGLALSLKTKLPLVGNSDVEFNRTMHRKVNDDVFISDLLRRQLYFVKGFHIGIKTEFGNSWISASVPASGILNIKMRYVINASLAYGFTAGYDFNNKYGVQIEYHIVNQNVQLSEVSSNSTLQNSNLRMNYNHIPLLFKIKWHPLRGIESKPLVMNYVLGVQYGWLRSSSAPNIDYTLIPNEINVKKPVYLDEWNAIMAISYDVYINQFFFLTFGGRAAFGGDLQKYTSNDLAITKSKNLTLGLEFGLHCKLPFWQKYSLH